MEFINPIVYLAPTGIILPDLRGGSACRVPPGRVGRVSSGSRNGADGVGRTVRVIGFDPDSPADAAAIRALARVDLVTGPDGTWSAGPPMSAAHDPSDAVPRPFAGIRLRRALFAPSPADFLAFAHSGARDVVPAAMLAGTPVVVALTAAERIWQSVPTPALRTAWCGSAAVGVTPSARAEGRAAFLADLLLDLLSYAGPDEIHWFSSDPS